MLEMVREYFEDGYEVIVEFYGYEDVMESWEEILEAFEEVESDEWMYWHGYEVDEVAHRFWLYQGSDE